MSLIRQENLPSQPNRNRRRGAAYLLVLSAGMLLSVVGIGILASSRSASRSASQAADLTEAAILAEAGVEWGMAAINNDAAWRTTYTHKVEVSKTMGRGTISFKLVDDVDTNLANNMTDPVRVYGIGRVGSAVRCYSVRMTGSGNSLAVLKNTVSAGGKFDVTDNLSSVGGPISSNSKMTVSSGKTVTGDASAISYAASGTYTGTKTTLATAQAMPSSSVFDTYKAMATTIPYANIASGSISKKVLSPGTNTVYAAAGLNSSGVYYIDVPNNSTLTITASRLVATLVVELESSARLQTSGALLWDPPRSDFPTLIVKGKNSSNTVTLAGTTSTLSELTNLTNYNPAGTPYPYTSGTTDTDTSDTYVSEFHGLLHVIDSGTSVALTNNFVLKGVLIADGDVSTATGVKLTLDSTISASPPQGYSSATTMTPDAGSWKWQSSP